jgi:hypothetical protein
MKTIRITRRPGTGTTPLEKASFERGCTMSPDFIVADSGSADIGPYPLGTDRAACDEVWQRHDIEAMLVAARRLRIPLILTRLGSGGERRCPSTGFMLTSVCPAGEGGFMSPTVTISSSKYVRARRCRCSCVKRARRLLQQRPRRIDDSALRTNSMSSG